MKFIKKTKDQEIILCFIIDNDFNKINLKKIETKIKNNNKNNHLMSIYIETKNRFFTILPLTKMNAIGKNTVDIKDIIQEKLKIFENQYNFETCHFTIFCKLMIF